MLNMFSLKKFGEKFKRQKGSDGNEEKARRASTGQIRQTSLLQMTVEVEVWRPGSRWKEETLYVLASHILDEGKDPILAQSYSFSLFTQIFENMLNANAPGHRIEIKHGKLGCFLKGEPFEVREQDDFAVAINDLYLNRGHKVVLNFIFQPEAQDVMVNRLVSVGIEAEVARRLGQRAIIEGDFRTPVNLTRPSRLPRRPQSAVFLNEFLAGAPDSLPTPDYSPQYGHEDGDLARGELEGSVIRGLGSPASPLISEPSELSHERMSTSSRRQSPIPAIRGVIRKVVGKKTAETKEEQSERLKGSYTEEERVTFKRGGDEDEQEDDLSKFETSHTEIADGEVELPEEKDEDDDEDEDDDISPEDRLVTRLQQLQNLEELTQVKDPKDTDGTSARWEECCHMFCRDPNDTKVDQLVTVSGLKTKIYQYQAFGVYWQMVTSRRLGGGFVADDMGLGKTLSFLAYIVVERQLSVLWREVKESREANDGKHLLADQSEDAKCPKLSKAGWIACPCALTNPTNRMAPQPGVRMACVPNTLVGNWWQQWKAHVETDDKVLAMKIVVDYPGAFGIDTNTEDRVFNSAALQNRTRIKAYVKGVKAGGKGNDSPKDYHEGYLLLTTKESYPKFSKGFEYEGQVHDPRNLGGWKKGTRNSLIFGIAMIDESHEEYFKNSGRGGILASLPTASNSVQPFLWGYSGTPFSQTPRGIEGVLWAIEKHAPRTDVEKTGWQTDPKFQQFEWKKLDNVCKLFDKQLKSNKRDDAAVDDIITKFKPFLTNFIIRRTADTMWFGHLLIKLKPHTHQDVKLRQNQTLSNNFSDFEAQFDSERKNALAQLQARWDNFPDDRRLNIRPTKLAFNTMCRYTWRSRLLASFPYLYELAIAGTNQLSLGEEEALGFRGSEQKEKNNPYWKNLRKIVESSPKCMWLYDFISQLELERDVNGNNQKLVILTKFPQVAFILKLFIQKYFPEDKEGVGMIAGRMKASEKTGILNAFTEALDDKGKRKTKKDIRYLIGTTRLMGVGLQLTRACNLVLMEPDNEFVREMQGYARVHRIGQKNPLSRSFRLINAESEIEQQILKRQEDRRELPGRLIIESEVEQFQVVEELDDWE